MGEAWTKALEKLLKAKEFDDVVMKEEFEFTSPLNAKLWEAWIRAAGDPECNVVDWIRRGVPLGMNCKIPTCGIFPETWEEDTVMGEAPAIDLMRDTRNYSSFYDLIEAAEEELGRYVQKGFAVIKDKEWIAHRFGSGTVSKMALIQKTKDDGRVKNRVVVDLLRSGGNARAVVPERLVLPRVIDVLEGARRLNANSTEYIKAAKREGWMPEGGTSAHGQAISLDVQVPSEPVLAGRGGLADVHGRPALHLGGANRQKEQNVGPGTILPLRLGGERGLRQGRERAASQLDWGQLRVGLAQGAHEADRVAAHGEGTLGQDEGL